MVRSTAAVLMLAVAGLQSACADSSPTAASPVGATAQSKAVVQSLRLVNTGSVDVRGLVVMFPDERITFGDVPAGATTTHVTATKGVYRHAAYQARLGTQVTSQPVIDWVGEQPMQGERFTYAIEASEGPPWGVNIRLMSVTRDR
jgi:uncharacterized cupredoxin-like copper-binding protein